MNTFDEVLAQVIDLLRREKDIGMKESASNRVCLKPLWPWIIIGSAPIKNLFGIRNV